ncbi:MAG: SLBB domain-containing protein [Gemmatimonadota bacterium]|nr:SLBB domain-containing protein [Gemmatimonadota bacterium]
MNKRCSRLATWQRNSWNFVRLSLCAVVLSLSLPVLGQRGAVEQFLRDSERQGGRRTPTALRGLIPSLFDQEVLKREVVDLRLITPPLEKPVDPNNYIIGPGDNMLVSIQGEMSPDYALTVTPEGLLGIPTVGVLEVSGLTLADLKTQVQNAARPVYPSGAVETILLYPRQFKITVSGAVNGPGPVIATPFERVSEILVIANRPTDIHTRLAATEPDFVLPSTYGSDRNIEIRHRNGTITRVDLRRYLATGDLDSNPTLRDGDVIYVPVRNVETGTVLLAGAVNIPGVYEHVAGDNLGVLLEMAGGLSVSTDRTRIEIARTIPMINTAPRIETISVDMGRGPSALGTPIVPLDRIFVRTAQKTNSDLIVVVRGEVRFPGTYPVQLDGVKLSQIVEMAGGFTEEAFIRGGTIVRNIRRDGAPASESINLERLARLRLSRLGEQERVDFEMQTGFRQQTVVADFERLFSGHDMTADVTLQPGDMVVIPSKNETVHVMGQVANPGQIPFESGMDTEYYILMAGGLSRHARDGKIQVIKMESNLWLPPDQTTVEVGDMIWVPRHPVRNYFAIFRETLTVMTALTTLYLVLQQISK